MALGEELRRARESKNLTASQVAVGTRMKVQVVEAIDAEDFSKVAAPVYGKGFIKLYAEYVGLDPRPLLQEYVVRFVEGSNGVPSEPPVAARSASARIMANRSPQMSLSASEDVVEEEDPTVTYDPDLFSRAPSAGHTRTEVSAGGVSSGSSDDSELDTDDSVMQKLARLLPVGLGVLLALICVVSILSKCSSDGDVSVSDEPLRVVAPPPAPYMD